MANTLFLYDGTAASRMTVQMMSSIVSMSNYKVYTASPLSLAKYSRIVFAVSPNTDHAWITAVLQQDLSQKKIGIIGVDVADAVWQMMCSHISKQMGEALVFAACVHTAADREEIIQAGERLQALTVLPGENDTAVLDAIETFLQQHNTCVLATGYDDAVRATPIEYVYHDKKIYMFSEGGKKFANLYRNPQVSLAVFDSYAGFEKLAGLQIDGRCRMIEPDEPIYMTIAETKGITKERIQAMPVLLHVLEIQLTEAVFLWAGFLKLGKAVRQVYRF